MDGGHLRRVGWGGLLFGGCHQPPSCKYAPWGFAESNSDRHECGFKTRSARIQSEALTAPGPAVNAHFSPEERQVISEEGHLHHHRRRRYSTGKVQPAYCLSPFTCGPYQEVGLGADIQSQACPSANLVQEDQSWAIRIAPRGRVTAARRRPPSICSPVKRAETFGMRAPFHGIMGRGGRWVGEGSVSGIKHRGN